LCNRHAIQEKQAAVFDRLQQLAHPVRVGRKLAAHMIVQADIAVEPRQVPIDPPPNLLRA